VAAAVLATACGSGEGSNGGGGGGGGGGGVSDPGEVLFVTGADGTGGYLSSGKGAQPLADFDNELSRITDDGRGGASHGFADFAALLEAQGYSVAEATEVGGDAETGVDLSGGALDGVDVLVLGSNNAVYTDDDIAAVTEFVRAGGGVVVFGDVNYGQDWGDAAASDSQFLAPFGLSATQDNTAEMSTDPADGDADHPILDGVEPWSTLGADVITVIGGGLVEPVIVLPFDGADVRTNPGPDEGPTRPPEPATDAVLAVAELGAGRVVAFYDRDLFFNDPREGDSAGTGLGDPNNERLATQMVDWAAGRI
jgi:hypothetical protein